LFTTKKIALVSVINDLASDSRVQKTCQTLVENGYKVRLIGRKLKQSPNLPNWPFETKRMNLFFTQGPLFYLFFNLRLFFILLFTKSQLLYSNDLDTLLPNYLISKIKGIPLIYDSHELFCEVPELQNSAFKKNIWLSIEGWIVPKLKYLVTVNQSIAHIFEQKYNVKFHVVRNISDINTSFIPAEKKELGLPINKKIILLQGAGINIDRGAEELVDAMQFIDDCLLLIIGSGDVWTKLEEKVKGGLSEKVILIHRLPKVKLMQYTHLADIGISIDKNTNLNYQYSLPNKVFDYIHAGVPILASRLPEIEKIINEFEIGEFIQSHNPIDISNAIKKMLGGSDIVRYKNNTVAAKSILNWENEKQKLVSLILSI